MEIAILNMILLACIQIGGQEQPSTSSSDQSKKQRYLDGFQRDIYFYQKVKGRVHVVNFPVEEPELTVDMVQQMLRAGLAAVGFGGRYLVFAEAGYMLRNMYRNILRYFYAGANSRVFRRGLFVEGAEQIDNLPERIIRDINDNAENATNNRDRSGWQVERVTNVRTVWLQMW